MITIRLNGTVQIVEGPNSVNSDTHTKKYVWLEVF